MFLATNIFFVGGIILYWGSLHYYYADMQQTREEALATPKDLREERQVKALLESLKQDGYTTQVQFSDLRFSTPRNSENLKGVRCSRVLLTRAPIPALALY